MARDTQPSVIKVAFVGWCAALRAIADMMPVAGPAFLFTLVAEAALQLLHSHSLAIEFAILPLYWVAQSLVLTPLAIAVHRYVLLKDVTKHYALDRSDQRFQQYFGFAVAVQALWLSLWVWWIIAYFVFGAPMMPGEPVPPEVGEHLGWILVLGFAPPLVTCFVIVRVTLSIAILFPAVATDAPGAGWSNARDDSEEHILRMFYAFAFGFVPTLLFDAVDDFILTPEHAGSHPPLQAVGIVVRAAKSVLIVSAFAPIASTFYVAYGRRLKGSAPVA
jgi:hypothetical protein